MEILEVGDFNLYRVEAGASTYLLSSKGGQLLNWYLSLADGSTRDVIYMPPNTDIASADFRLLRGGMPVLFPFAGSSFIDGKPGFWKSPDGGVLPMRQHGYAIGGNFDVSPVGDASLKAFFRPSEECKQAYPFDYEFSATYRFGELSFTCELMLANRGAQPIPWGAGLHPYFMLPWHSGASRKGYRLLCDAKKAYHILEDGSFTPADPAQNCFDDADMQNRIHTKMKSGIVKFGPKNGEEDITLKIGLDGQPSVAATLVTWAESPDAPYYCVEPWMNMPNCASNPVHFVDPGKSKSFVVEISLM